MKRIVNPRRPAGVTVKIAFDNSTRLVKQNVCTVFGSLIAN